METEQEHILPVERSGKAQHLSTRGENMFTSERICLLLPFIFKPFKDLGETVRELCFWSMMNQAFVVLEQESTLRRCQWQLNQYLKG